MTRWLFYRNLVQVVIVIVLGSQPGILILLNATVVSVISSDPLCKDGNFRLSTVPLPFSDQNVENIDIFSRLNVQFLILIITICCPVSPTLYGNYN